MMSNIVVIVVLTSILTAPSFGYALFFKLLS